MLTLGVNIDHIATIRQARQTVEPDPVAAAVLAELAGADGITVHLREDRRHIQDRDVRLLRQTVRSHLNLEMAATEEMLAIALDIKPDYVTLVPEKRQEVTTEGGLDIVGQIARIGEIVDKLQNAAIPVSLFIDAETAQIEASVKVQAKFIELHTGQYAEAKDETSRKLQLALLASGCEQAIKSGLRVNAGHGLTYWNVYPVACLPGMEELNIGHTIISRAALVGIERAVREMKQAMRGKSVGTTLEGMLLRNPRKESNQQTKTFMSATQSNSLPLWVQDRDTLIAQSTDAEWRYQTPPDYTRSKENLAQESICNHLEGTLEAIVQNLVRAFEMEVSFKSDPQHWLSVVSDKFRVSTNGGVEYTAAELKASGTYNLFMADSQHYKASEEDFESSGKIFHTTFPQGFPWEVLEVFSGHQTSHLNGGIGDIFKVNTKDFAPTGETVEVIGMSIARVTDDLKIVSLEHYFDNTLFLDKLTAGGKTTTSKLTANEKQATGQEKPTFLGIIKRLWNWREKQAISEPQASRCPFSTLLR